ncbi:MAG: hypothetical protein NTU53_13250 [Planctomycetota bacterium]|nr:hypothetical protein [Planctomycetota bacterium]
MLFPVFEDTYFLNEPDFAAFNIQQILVVAGSFFYLLDKPGGGYDWTKPNEAATRQVARRAAKLNQILCIDIEHLPEDIRRDSPAGVQNTVQIYTQIVNWIRSERPDVKLGFYGSFPRRDYWTPVSYWQAMDHRGERWFDFNLPRFAEKYRIWQAANDVFKPLAAKVDYLFPSLYSFYNDPAGWVYYAKGNILEAKRFGKPVIPFIWMEYHNGTPLIGQQISSEFWRLQLDTIRQMADGVVIWGGVHSSPDAPPVPEQWNAADPWWIQTRSFIADLLANP